MRCFHCIQRSAPLSMWKHTGCQRPGNTNSHLRPALSTCFNNSTNYWFVCILLFPGRCDVDRLFNLILKKVKLEECLFFNVYQHTHSHTLTHFPVETVGCAGPDGKELHCLHALTHTHTHIQRHTQTHTRKNTLQLHLVHYHCFLLEILVIGFP